MDEKELKIIQSYIKKRYDEVGMDYKTFSCDIDMSLSYYENMTIVNKYLEVAIPKIVKKTELTEQRLKAEQMQKEEQDRHEAEIQARLDKELENITADSKELEKMYEYPIECIEMVASGKTKGFLLHGETSLGKSYRVKEVLKRLGKTPINRGVGDYMFVSGHITPMRFYAKMYECKDKIVIFDDVDILSNIIIVNMIKAGLNENSGNVVEYHTTKKMDIESSFIFNGRMIILLNKIPDNNEHLRAIMSRVEHFELKFDREQKIKIIFEMAHKGTGEIMSGTSVQERIEIAKWLRDNTSRATTNFNIRLFLQAVNFYKWKRGRWKELTLGQITNDEYATLIIQGCSSEEWEEETGLNVRTMQRLKKKLGLSKPRMSYNG